MNPLDKNDPITLTCLNTLVIKAFESVGKRIVRVSGDRYKTLSQSGEPLHLAHTLWPMREVEARKALRGSFECLPYCLPISHTVDNVPHDFDDLETALTDYVLTMVAAGRSHRPDRMISYLAAHDEAVTLVHTIDGLVPGTEDGVK